MIMKRPATEFFLGAAFCLLLVAAFFAGCTGTSQPASDPAATATTVQQAATTAAPVTTVVNTVPAMAASVTTTAVAATATPAPVYTPSDKTLIVYTAASLKGVSKEIGKQFSAMYPGHSVTFNLDGTQALKTQVENGAYADVFISASNSYTKTLQGEGYFINSTVKPLTTN